MWQMFNLWIARATLLWIFLYRHMVDEQVEPEKRDMYVGERGLNISLVDGAVVFSRDDVVGERFRA